MVGDDANFLRLTGATVEDYVDIANYFGEEKAPRDPKVLLATTP